MLTVYLSGEIHTDWRDQIAHGARDLNVVFTGPVTDSMMRYTVHRQAAGCHSSCYTKRKFGLSVSLHAQSWPKRHGSQAYT